MTSKLIQAIGAGLAASTVTAFAGDFSADSTSSTPSGGNGGDWCEGLQGIGTVYKNKENPWIQEVKFFGRAHQHFVYVDGDVDGNDFSGKGDELRRLRFGASVKFLNGFKILGRVNLERGDFRDTSIGYSNFDELYLNYGFGDVGVFEDLTVGYGFYKTSFGGEEWQSSKKIKTLERSNLNNYYADFGARSTGARIEFGVNNVDYQLQVFTTEASDGDSPVLANGNGGIGYMISAEFEGFCGDNLLQGIYHDATQVENEVFSYEWAISATHEREIGPINLFTNVTYGENYDNDAAYGIVIMPYFDLIEDKLEAVFRYQYLKGEGNLAFSGTPRYFRRAVDKEIGLARPSGDTNHTFYAGLNYFFCDHNLKLMAGVEYETIDGGARDGDALTLSSALRFYF